MREELLDLVRQTRCFITQEWGEITPSPQAAPKPSTPQLQPKKPAPVPNKERSLDTMKALLQQVAPTLELVEPNAPIVLLQTQDQERPFLESVAAAITRSFLPAEVMSGKPHLARCKLVIAAAPGKTPHELIKRSGKPPLLVLAPLESYRNDQEQKRALWETLKRLLPSL